MYAIYSFQACRACTFDRPGLATIGAYPGCVCRAETYAIGIVLSLNSFVQKEYHSRINPFIAGKWAKHEKRKYNPQGGSIPPTSLPRVASYRRQPRAIESKPRCGSFSPITSTPKQMGYLKRGVARVSNRMEWSDEVFANISNRMECLGG